MLRSLATPLMALAILFAAGTAHAHTHANAKGVGLGVAAGAAWSGTDLEGFDNRDATGLSWGFFVDIPLLDTFYISPATTIYELDLGKGKKPVTDIDLNFKFIVPLHAIKVGAGVTAGLTVAEETYSTHMGGLGYLSYNAVQNLDLFAMAQYKRLIREGQEVDDMHLFVGTMFRF